MPNSSSPADKLSGQANPERPDRSWRFNISTWLPVVLMVGCIVVETQAFFGSNHTTGPLRYLVERLAGPMPDAQWDVVHHIIRKCGHFAGYGLLSYTWFRAFWRMLQEGETRAERSRMAGRLPAHLLAMLGTFLIASADEFHQSFLPNRTGTFVDVLIDCLGALIVQVVIFLVMLRLYRRKRDTSV